MFFILGSFWFIRSVKIVLFWLYLWQLKEYHIGRLFDHFRTYKGKKLIFHPLQISKIIFAGLFILSILKGGLASSFSLILVLFLVYFTESTLFVYNLVFKRQIKKPVLTKKTILLISVGLIITILFPIIIFLIIKNLFWFAFSLLVFDVLTPKITSLIVLSFQPFAVLWRKKLIKKAKEKREKFNDLIVIGITGSYGKTSTKEFLATILSQKVHPVKSAKGGVPLSAGQFNRVNVLKTKEHINAEIGIAQTILNELKPEHQILIAEIGAYERGKIKEVCEFLQPKIGILTGINEQHMATFGSQENIIKAKYELIESLPKDGVAFFNAKNKYCVELYQKTKIKKYLYGEGAKFFGEENILGAMAVAKELGMTEKEISSACQKIENKLPGIQQKRGINGLTILDAIYSANPAGVIGHLEYLKTLPGKKMIVMPCLIELGKASKEAHQRIGEKIGEICNLAIITSKDKLREIRDEAIKTGMKAEDILFIENPQEIFEKIKSFCKDGDVILLEGRIPNYLINLLID